MTLDDIHMYYFLSHIVYSCFGRECQIRAAVRVFA